MVVCQYFLKGECRFGDSCRNEHTAEKRKTVCQHFLNGYCRFGDKCRNEHPSGRANTGFGQQNSGFSGRSGQWGKSYPSNQNRFDVLSRETQHSKGVEDDMTPSQIQRTIQTELAIWEKSKQWPLSCFTYTKEEPCLPGLLDFSPEEIRLEAYNANAEGKAGRYQQGLKTLITANQQKRQQLGRMSVSQIQEEIKKQRSHKAAESMEAGSSMLQTQPGIGFNGHSSFGQMSSFATSGPVFQSTGFPSPAATLNQPSNLFSTSNSTNQVNLFGQSNVPAMTGNVFGNTLSASNQQTGMTSFPLTGHSTTMFSTNLSQSAASNTGFFGVKTESKPGVFGSVPSQTVTGVFPSESQVQKGNGSSSSMRSTPEATSSMEQSTTVPLSCSEEDMQAFRADSFVLGKIPECPPPLELC